ncbi:MAG: hypothetical protein ABI977_06065 [Acidobacteriota bacterium]
MLWLLSAIAGFFWFFGLVIGGAGIFIHLVLLVALALFVIELIGGRESHSFAHL